MANDNVDDLGIPKRSREQIWNWLREHDSTIRDKAMPLLNSEYSIDQHNTYLTHAIGTVIPNVRRHFRPKEPESHIYALTLTTKVIDGKPLRGYIEFMSTLRRIKGLPGVFIIHAYFELTQQQALHVHAIVKTTQYLDAGKVRKFNCGHHIKVSKVKDLPRQPKGSGEQAAYTYASKELDNADCLRVMRYSKEHVSSTMVEL